ncbi:MAG TPA: SGNH/GDSL hydrolase family protein, partial [Terracidiphilus sp.]|nr:SGNH/GDSL hydrolase family protein [Terracidiphilus sp.]
MKQSWLLPFLALLVASGTSAPAQKLALHDGDRVAFYGDSITAQRYYTRFMEDFVLTRYPQMHLAFFNAGVPGDRVSGGYTGDVNLRLRRDLFPLQPTVVTIMLGMNDGYYLPYDPKYQAIYEDGYRKLLASIQTTLPETRITLISPTPYDEVTHGTEFPQYDQVITRYAVFVKNLANSSHLSFSDFNQPIASLDAAGLARNPSLAALLVPDRIHPSEAAHWVMAATLARTWGMSPIVSSAHLDAAQPVPVAAENTQVSALSQTDGKLAWTELDNALPLPLDLESGMVLFVLGISDLADMDRQMLRVDDLSAPRYILKIDGRTIASFSRDQLAAGVNLALYDTPMEGQARDIDGIELKRTHLDEARFLLAIEDPVAP